MIFSQSKDRLTFSSKQSENIRRYHEMSKKSVDSLDYQMDSQQFSLEGTTAQADITGPQIRIEDTEDTLNMGSKDSVDSGSNDGSVHMINGTYIPETVNDSFD